MSYSISLKCPTCTCPDHEHYSINLGGYTWNVSGMYSSAFPPLYAGGQRSLYTLNGMSGFEAGWILEHIVSEMCAYPEKYRAMNPPNGWGDYTGALMYIERILRACRERPTWILEVE